MPAFDCFVGIDWSGDKHPWQKGLKVAIAYPGHAAPVLKECPGRKGGWSRTDVVEWIADQFQDQRALIGIDFAFGFPEVTLPGNIVLDWEYAEEVCATEPNFYGGTFFRPPVYGHIAIWSTADGCRKTDIRPITFERPILSPWKRSAPGRNRFSTRSVRRRSARHRFRGCGRCGLFVRPAGTGLPSGLSTTSARAARLSLKSFRAIIRCHGARARGLLAGRN